MPKKSVLDELLDEPAAEDPGPSPWAYLLHLRQYAERDEVLFTRALAGLWNECACYEMPVRTWRELQGVPVGCCPQAATSDEVAALIGLLIGVYLDFGPPPPKPRRKKKPSA